MVTARFSARATRFLNGCGEHLGAIAIPGNSSVVVCVSDEMIGRWRDTSGDGFAHRRKANRREPGRDSKRGIFSVALPGIRSPVSNEEKHPCHCRKQCGRLPPRR